MIGWRMLAAPVALLCASGGAASDRAVVPAADALRAHVAVLASDAMMGRDPGRPEYMMAATYVIDRFRDIGLRPAGDDGGFLQAVPLVRYRPQGEGKATWTPPGGAPVPLIHGVDYYAEADAGHPQLHVSGPVVFVGYGISAPMFGHDDYRGLDVRGKIVAVASGGPARLGGDLRGILWNDADKRATAAAHGAIGMIGVLIPQPGLASFATTARAAAYTQATWALPDGDTGAGPAAVPLLGTISETAMHRLFGDRWRNRNGGFVATAASGILTADTATTVTAIPSANVMAILPGSDPALAHETVVVSAHLDHLGLTAATTGDRINNGALDNAIGVAAMIEQAKRLAGRAHRPRRSILFLAVTGEEAGLLGSDYFVRHRPAAAESMVADINLDMPILTFRFEDMIVYGRDHSTLGPLTGQVLAQFGVPITGDPDPRQSIFARSDQFSFARQGIPAIMPWPGMKGPGAAAIARFEATRYHQPSDDIDQPIDWPQAARFVTITTAMTTAIADAPTRPAWNDRSLLGTWLRHRSPRPRDHAAVP